MLEGNVLITGGSGFLGTAIIDMAKRDGWDAKFTAYARHEDGLTRLKMRHPDVRCVPGDILDLDHLTNVAVGHDVLVHAAAMKRVPESEDAVDVTVAINIGGTRNAARAAMQAGIRRAILVSTDKACLPVNLYGATKMVAERIWSEAARTSDVAFATARYGNVIGSTGSIIPIFRRQLAQTGKITLTDGAMTRFWMPVQEAVTTILTAHGLADVAPGAVFTARCQQMPVGELACMVVRQWLNEQGAGGTWDCWEHVNAIGHRPGEKMHETLVHEYEMARALTRSDGYLILPSTYTPEERTAAADMLIHHFDYQPAEAGWAFTSDGAGRISAEDMLEGMAAARDILP